MVDHDLAVLLRESGQKATAQRLALLSALRAAHGHLTASQLLERVDPALSPSLDLSTVYRTLVTAERLGLVTRFQHEGTDEFEWYEREHHHLVCSSCGCISELDSEALQELYNVILRREGFLISAKHLAFSGICSKCSSA